MSKVDISQWKEFRVGAILKVDYTNSIAAKNNLAEGDIPYITRSAANNGYSGTCGNAEKINRGNCITIGAEGFVAFWQPNDFVAGNKVYELRGERMNEMSALFICAALNVLSNRYSFADARILAKIENEIIKLPATPNGEPDWDYMEAYIKGIREDAQKTIDLFNRIVIAPPQ